MILISAEWSRLLLRVCYCCGTVSGTGAKRSMACSVLMLSCYHPAIATRKQRAISVLTWCAFPSLRAYGFMLTRVSVLARHALLSISLCFGFPYVLRGAFHGEMGFIVFRPLNFSLPLSGQEVEPASKVAASRNFRPKPNTLRRTANKSAEPRTKKLNLQRNVAVGAQYLPSVPRLTIKVEGNFLRFFIHLCLHIYVFVCVCRFVFRRIFTTFTWYYDDDEGGMYRKMNGTHRTIEGKYVLKSAVCV